MILVVTMEPVGNRCGGGEKRTEANTCDIWLEVYLGG